MEIKVVKIVVNVSEIKVYWNKRVLISGDNKVFLGFTHFGGCSLW